MQGRIDSLYHYPIKGLSPQALASVVLNAGEGFPFDRNFGFARHDSGFDPAQPLPKDRFLMLARDARLAGLDTSFDPATRHLTIRAEGREVLSADLASKAGIAAAEAFFATMFAMTDARSPRFVHAAPHRFTDVAVVSPQMMNAVSLVNLASIRALEEKSGQAVAPLRFRANIYFDGRLCRVRPDRAGNHGRRGADAHPQAYPALCGNRGEPGYRHARPQSAAPAAPAFRACRHGRLCRGSSPRQLGAE
jgi:uncharacterized protein YcbX